MSLLENIIPEEANYLKAYQARIIWEAILNLIPREVRIAGLSKCVLTYDSETRKVFLYKPLETKLKYIRPIRPNLVPVETPNAAEEEVLRIAQQYLERFRAPQS